MRPRANQEGMLTNQPVAEHPTPGATDLMVPSLARCPGGQPGGRRCRSKLGPSGYCHLHDPANSERLAVARKLGGVIAGTRRVHIELDLSSRDGIRKALADVCREVARNRLTASQGNTLIAAINSSLRLAELELEAKVIAIEKAIEDEIEKRRGRAA
jgi:hypothetical protein